MQQLLVLAVAGEQGGLRGKIQVQAGLEGLTHISMVCGVPDENEVGAEPTALESGGMHELWHVVGQTRCWVSAVPACRLDSLRTLRTSSAKMQPTDQMSTGVA